MNVDQQLVMLLLTMFGSGFGLGYGYWRRWATIELRRALSEQADAIHVEYAKDRQFMAGCLRAADVLPFEQANAPAPVSAPDTRI